MSNIQLDASDAAELAEMLTFISQRLAGPDHAQLTDSFARFVTVDGYNTAELHTDLARFTFCSAITTANNSSAKTPPDSFLH